jgi:hypothetical protein
LLLSDFVGDMMEFEMSIDAERGERNLSCVTRFSLRSSQKCQLTKMVSRGNRSMRIDDEENYGRHGITSAYEEAISHIRCGSDNVSETWFPFFFSRKHNIIIFLK